MEIRSALVQADALIEGGRYADAVRTLQLVVHRKPEFPDVHHQLGIALSLAGEQVMAESHLQRALELNPEYAEAHLNLAILLFERSAYNRAREHLREFTRIAGESGRGHPSVALDDLAKRHAALAERYRSYGLLDEAEVQLRHALRLRPGYCDLRLALGRVLFERGKLDESAAQVEILIHQRPHYDEAHLLRGRIERRRGRLDVARASWAQVRRGSAAVQARALLDGLKHGSTDPDGDAARRSLAGGGP